MSSSPESPPPRHRSPFWTGLFRFLGLLAVLAALGFAGFLWVSKNAVDSARHTLSRIADAFRPETITETFAEFTELKARGTDGNILEVATAEATEHFARATELKLFDRALPLGVTVSEISAPATYRFHIDLNGRWFLTTDGNRVMVVAPAVAPSLPVAFDSAGVRKRTKAGWARWDADENLAALETRLTEQLARRAGVAAGTPKIRDEARVAVAKFVRSWLLGREHWGAETFTEIAVLFSDEVGGENGKSLAAQPPSLRFDPAAPAEIGPPP
ncbi:MAG: hypothetical protein H7A52_06610 [Akkermansiaceae bacterium]|nr:hypothetical protein [Akkermansiaceae bacterium]